MTNTNPQSHFDHSSDDQDLRPQLTERSGPEWGPKYVHCLDRRCKLRFTSCKRHLELHGMANCSFVDCLNDKDGYCKVCDIEHGRWDRQESVLRGK